MGCLVVEEINFYKINENLEKIRKFLDILGVKVVIVKVFCRFYWRYKFFILKRYVDFEKCKNCKVCLSLGCFVILIKEKFIIDENLCFVCGMCEDVCKFGVILS